VVVGSNTYCPPATICCVPLCRTVPQFLTATIFEPPYTLCCACAVVCPLPATFAASPNTQPLCCACAHAPPPPQALAGAAAGDEVIHAVMSALPATVATQGVPTQSDLEAR
jgi:hypothetical protein